MSPPTQETLISQNIPQSMSHNTLSYPSFTNFEYPVVQNGYQYPTEYQNYNKVGVESNSSHSIGSNDTGYNAIETGSPKNQLNNSHLSNPASYSNSYANSFNQSLSNSPPYAFEKSFEAEHSQTVQNSHVPVQIDSQPVQTNDTIANNFEVLPVQSVTTNFELPQVQSTETLAIQDHLLPENILPLNVEPVKLQSAAETPILNPVQNQSQLTSLLYPNQQSQFDYQNYYTQLAFYQQQYALAYNQTVQVQQTPNDQFLQTSHVCVLCTVVHVCVLCTVVCGDYKLKKIPLGMSPLDRRD